MDKLTNDHIIWYEPFWAWRGERLSTPVRELYRRARLLLFPLLRVLVVAALVAGSAAGLLVFFAESEGDAVRSIIMAVIYWLGISAATAAVGLLICIPLLLLFPPRVVVCSEHMRLERPSESLPLRDIREVRIEHRSDGSASVTIVTTHRARTVGMPRWVSHQDVLARLRGEN